MASDDPYADRRRLNFAQAEGVEPLPTQLQLREISQQLRALLWELLYLSIKADVDERGDSWEAILYNFHVRRQFLPADRFDKHLHALVNPVRTIIYDGNYVNIFDFLQFVLRHPSCTSGFAEELDDIFTEARAAYAVLDDKTIIPKVSEEDSRTLERAFADLAAREFRGARAHLKEAASALIVGNYTNSVRESIHSVESVARTLEPSGKLSSALAQLERSAAIHGSLKRGFENIYGYTSDEKGIRHPLLEGPAAKVDETDAIFMIGACAAFVSYLIGKARAAGLLDKK
jgi:hypothetical protein